MESHGEEHRRAYDEPPQGAQSGTERRSEQEERATVDARNEHGRSQSAFRPHGIRLASNRVGLAPDELSGKDRHQHNAKPLCGVGSSKPSGGESAIASVHMLKVSIEGPLRESQGAGSRDFRNGLSRHARCRHVHVTPFIACYDSIMSDSRSDWRSINPRLLSMPFIAVLMLACASGLANPATLVREGSSPQLARDPGGTIRMIFGRKDTIFVITSKDQGETFGAAMVVGVVPKMHLGNTRGPTIASARNRSVVMAVDQGGNITTFELAHGSDQWTRHSGTLNDAEGSAPEGLATVAATDSGAFLATWLDNRDGHQNQIYFGAIALQGETRAPNRRLYSSPDGHVCECCRPSIAITGHVTAVMFRNWLAGARDMYVTVAADGGKPFASPRKLGSGTWKIDACPMDGGALAIDPTGAISSVWRRENTVYYGRLGEPEQRIGDGRSPMMSSGTNGPYIVWQDGQMVKLTRPGSESSTVVGEGRLPQVLALPDGRALVAWEKGGSVYYRKM